MTFAKTATAILTIVFGLGMSNASVASDEKSEVMVMMNMARILRLPSAASTVVIGNPVIADAVIQDPRTLVLTGKGYGSTNLIALDSVGNPIADLIVHVAVENKNMITVFQGLSKTSMSCTPNCQPMAIGGDDPIYTQDVASSLSSAASVGDN